MWVGWVIVLRWGLSLGVTYFDEMLPASHPAGACGVQNRLSPWKECMQSNVRNIACPDDFVMSMDGRYAANAGAIGGHGCCHAQAEHRKTDRQKNTRPTM